MNNILKALCVLIALSVVSCHYEDFDDQEKRLEIIEQSSELYNYVQAIADENDGDSASDVTCLQFIYPIGLYTVDQNDAVISLDLIIGNQSFLDFLNQLDPTDNISISYPIETMLDDGTIVSINNNIDLLASIEACIEQQLEIIRECDNLLNEIPDCVWKVGYSYNDTNDFLGAQFDGDGITYFEYDDDTDEGSWNALFIENQLFINIHLLNDTSIYGQRFNKNWRVTLFSSEKMVLETDAGEELIINKYCTPDDTNDCFNLNFESCENDQTPGIADYLLADYDGCINEIMRLDSAVDTIAYYGTLNNAANQMNPIDSTIVYNNTATVETIYVGISNGITGDYDIIEISLTTISCP